MAKRYRLNKKKMLDAMFAAVLILGANVFTFWFLMQWVK